MKKDKVLLHGSYYGDNFGDTLFVILFTNWLKQYGIKSENIVTPFASNRVRSLIDVSKDSGIKTLDRCKVLVLMGGGYLGEPLSNRFRWSLRCLIRHMRLIIKANIKNIPYAFIGVGVGPISSKLLRSLIVKVCNDSYFTVVRDIESKNYLIKYGVKEDKVVCSVDSILYLEHNNYEDFYSKNIKLSENIFKKENDTVYIGIHLPIYNSYGSELKNIINEINEYCSDLKKYKLVLFNDFYKEGYDYKIKDAILSRFDRQDILEVPYTNPNQMISLLNNLDILITSKLHCGIVANCLNKYVISIAEHSKTERLYKQLKLSHRSIMAYEYVNGDLLSLLKEYDKVEINKVVDDSIRKKAKSNREYLFEFLQENYRE